MGSPAELFKTVGVDGPTICIIMRPAGVVVSMFSAIDRKPAPALPIRSMMARTHETPGFDR
jgi:hypothetical protein